MIRQIPKIALLLGALAVAGQASAYGYYGHGGGYYGHGGGGGHNYWGVGLLGAVIGGAVVGSVLTADRPVYVAPQPVYVAPPQPVYVQQPVYYAPPPPVYYAPQPVYYGPGYRRY